MLLCLYSDVALSIIKQGCGVGSLVIRLQLLSISIIPLRLQLRLPLRTDSDLQLY